MHGQNATLVVIEFGASWPIWLDPGASGNVAVVAQHYEGAPASIVVQVENRLARLLATKWRIDDVILVSNGRADLESLSARALLARNLLEHLRAAGGVRLVFALAEEHGRRATHSLLNLQAALSGRAIAAGIALAVRVGDQEPVYAHPGASSLLRTA